MKVMEHLVGLKEEFKGMTEIKTHGSSAIRHGAQSLKMLGLSEHQAVLDFLCKHVHLMNFYSHFSTC